MRLFQIIFLTVALTTTSLTFAAPADAAGSYIVVDAVDCNPDPETQTFWPLATVRRGGGLPDDNRTTTVMYLYDGATMIESLSAGKVNPDGVTATSGVVNVPTGDSVVVAPWGGRFGDDEPAGVTPLDPGAEYELRVRVYDFDAGEYTWEEATCSFEPRECDGVTSAEMKGPRPGYIGSGEMSTFPNSKFVCDGYWLPRSTGGFIPQGLALQGKTAWVAGYIPDPKDDKKGTCVVQKVSLDSGVQMAGQVGLKDKDNKKSTCNHAGGIALTPKGLFVSDTKTLWLLNPAKIGSGDAVKRTWALKGVNGSFLAMPVNGNVGIGSWKKGKAGKVSVFSLNGLMAKKITTLVDKKKKPKEEGDPPLGKQLTPVRADYKPVAVNANGGLFSGSKLITTGSLSTCGMLRTANGGIGFGPGAEEIEFDSDGYLWGIFEATAKKYYTKNKKKGKEKVVPMLAKFDPAILEEGTAKGDCK